MRRVLTVLVGALLASCGGGSSVPMLHQGGLQIREDAYRAEARQAVRREDEICRTWLREGTEPLSAIRGVSTSGASGADLRRVERIVKQLGFVNAPEGFIDSPKVINGGSDLLIALYGENGRHARSAIGIAALPANAPVEVEMIVQVKA